MNNHKSQSKSPDASAPNSPQAADLKRSHPVASLAPAETGNEPIKAAPKTADSAETKKPASGMISSLDDIISQNGANLRQTLSRLVKGPGRRLRSAFRVPEFDDHKAALNNLLADSKGSIRLRNLLGIGLQCGELPTSREGVWGAIINLTDSYLRRVDSPRPPSLSQDSGDLLIQRYHTMWAGLCNQADKKAKQGDGAGMKFFEKNRDILLLDAFFAHCLGRLDETQFIAAAASMLPVPAVADPLDGSVPWTFSAVVAAGPTAVAQVIQAASIHEKFSSISSKLTLAKTKIFELEEQRKTLRQELAETNDALAEESVLLVEAQTTIANLRIDVGTAANIYKHKLDDTRARMLGLLEGEITRHLKTIQDCMNMDPPRVKVATERVDTLLRTLNKEIEWLTFLE